jgi:hypothetical protein
VVQGSAPSILHSNAGALRNQRPGGESGLGGGWGAWRGLGGLGGLEGSGKRARAGGGGGAGNTTLEGMGSAQGGGCVATTARAEGSAGEMRGAWKPPGSAACVALAWGVWLVRVEPKGWSEAAASRERRFRRVWSGAWAASGGRARIGLIRSSEKCGLDKWWTGRTRTSAGDAKVRRPKGETRRRKGSRTRHVEESGKTDRRGKETAGTS